MFYYLCSVLVAIIAKIDAYGSKYRRQAIGKL